MKLDNTIRSTFVTCPRKYYWRHIENLQPAHGSTSLRFGSAWHAGLEAFYKALQRNDTYSDCLVAASNAATEEFENQTKTFNFYDDYRTIETLLQALVQYADTYYTDKDNFKILEVERIFAVPVTDSVTFTGKIDLIIEMSGQRWIMEHKTTSESIPIQQKKINRDPQLLGYVYAAQSLHDIQAEGIIVNTASIKATKSRTTGLYGKPTIDFGRYMQIYTPGDLATWEDSFLYTANLIENSILDNDFPAILDSCYRYGACSYTPLCEQNRPANETNKIGFIVTPPWNVEES